MSPMLPPYVYPPIAMQSNASVSQQQITVIAQPMPVRHSHHRVSHPLPWAPLPIFLAAARIPSDSKAIPPRENEGGGIAWQP